MGSSSLTSNQTWVPCFGSIESSPLGHHGSIRAIALILKKKVLLNPNLLSDYTFFICFPFVIKFCSYPPWHRNHWCQIMQHPLCCQIQWLISLRILFDLLAEHDWADHLMLPSLFIYNFIYLFIYLFMAVPSLRCCTQLFSSCREWGLL